MMQTRSLGARRGSAVVSLPGDHYKMDLHVLDKEQMGKKWIAYTVYARRIVWTIILGKSLRFCKHGRLFFRKRDIAT